MFARSRGGADVGKRGHGVVIGHADGREPGLAGAGDELGRGQPAVRRSGMEVKVDQRCADRARTLALSRPPARARFGAVTGGRLVARRPLALDERAVLANQQLEVLALLVGKLEKHLLAFGVFEPFAVALEEPVRAALAANADAIRLEIVDAVAAQLLAAGREQAVGRALEKQERRPRLQPRILLEQVLVAALERLQVMDFFGRQLAEHLARARVLHQLDAAPVELHAAAFGGNRDAQRVARKQQLGVGGLVVGRAPGAAGFAGAIDLHHALARGEGAGRRHFLDERLDVGAEEFVRAVAGLADQVEVARVPVGMLESKAAFAEIDLAGDARVDHPLQGAVDGRAADAMILALDQIDQVVGAQVSLLLEEHVDDQVALARALGAGGAETIQIRNGRRDRHGAVLRREGGAAAAGRRRVRVLDGEAAARDGVDEINLGALQVADADRIHEQLDAV